MEDYWSGNAIVPMRGLVVKKLRKSTRDYSDFIVVHTDKLGIYYCRVIHRKYGSYANQYEKSINFNWIYRLNVPNFYKRFKPKVFDTYVTRPKPDYKPEWDQELIDKSVTVNMTESNFLINLNGGLEL